MEAAAKAAPSVDIDGQAAVPAVSPVRPLRVAALAPAELGELREQWAELTASAAEPNAFAEQWFFEAALVHLAAPGDLRIVAVSEGERLIGLLPVHGSGRYGRIPVRHLRNWMHPHCFLGTPLVSAGAEEDFWTAVLRFLDRQQWAAGFFHIESLTEDGPVHRGLTAAARGLGRSCDIVHRKRRALLESGLSPQEYYELNVRKKKRKELKRLSARLGELGAVEARTLADASELRSWCDDFLALEKSGWKGESGSALGCAPETDRFFREAVAAAFAAGKLDFLRLDLDRRPLAMLVNFVTPPGGFSFKIAIDEEFARFSPGVLIQLENLRVLERPELGWMDSCASENHPMIDSLWAERRSLVAVTVPLAGRARGAVFRICRFVEDGAARLRALRAPSRGNDND